MKKYIGSFVASLLPMVTFAQYTISGLDDIAGTIITVVNFLFPVLITVAVVAVIWGIFKFILNAGDEEARKTGRSMILWGVIGIFLMLSIWGLVNILVNTIGLDTDRQTVVNVIDPAAY